MSVGGLGWFGIFRLGLVQTALGAVVVLTTSTLNRVMIVEWALPAVLPGLLVGLHYAVQILRPRFGYGSDVAGRRTNWIIGGMFVLASGGVLAAVATAWMATRPGPGIALAFAAFVLIGLGVGASGTSLLALLAKQVDPARRAGAATLVWLMMIVGFVVTAGVAGQFLDPFSPQRLVVVCGITSAAAFVLALVAVIGVERSAGPAAPATGTAAPRVRSPFMTVLREVWSETRARRFTVFVFVSMLAYSAQDLILEPFAGIAFGFTPGESTRLGSVQYMGVLLGMILVGVVGGRTGRTRFGSLRAWTIAGCAASALSLLCLTAAGLAGPPWPLHASVFALGAANGAFAVSAIGMMMSLAGEGRRGREGTRMGLWGAAQAFAFGLGGFLGAAGVDVTRILVGSPTAAYAVVFALQAALFGFAARLLIVFDRRDDDADPEGQLAPAGTDGYLAHPRER
ncbi:BCD family MFS transporter [Halomonas denitrificans]|nr:BCD family MFS transporter [Halomonas denitrificans]